MLIRRAFQSLQSLFVDVCASSGYNMQHQIIRPPRHTDGGAELWYNQLLKRQSIQVILIQVEKIHCLNP